MNLNGRITNPGELRTKITLQTTTITQDAGGAQVESWVNFASNPHVYAKITFAHGAESVSSDALKTANRLTALIRYRSDLTSAHAFLLNGERWRIIGTPDNIQARNEYLELQAELIKGSV